MGVNFGTHRIGENTGSDGIGKPFELVGNSSGYAAAAHSSCSEPIPPPHRLRSPLLSHTNTASSTICQQYLRRMSSRPIPCSIAHFLTSAVSAKAALSRYS